MKFDLDKESNATPIIILVMLAAYVISYFLKSFLARHLGSNFYGEYSIALQVLYILSFFTLLGTNAASTRFLSKFIHDHNKDDAASFITWNIKFIRRTYLICWALGVCSLGLMLVLHHMGINHIGKYHLALYMFWVAPMSASILLLCTYLLANNNFILSTMLKGAILNAIFFVYFIIAFKIWPHEVDTLKIVGVLIVSTTSMGLICLYLVIRKVEAIKGIELKEIMHGKIQAQPVWLKTSMKLAVSQVSYYFTVTFVFLILAWILKSQSQVAYFSACLTISGIIYVIAVSIRIPLQPIVSSLIGNKEGLKKLQHKINVGNLMLTVLLLPVMLLIIIYAKTLLGHFGHEFVQARLCCIVLTIAIVIHSYAILGMTVMSCSGYAEELMWISLIGLVLIVILGCLFTFAFGLVGMAYAYVVYALMYLITISVHCHRKAHLRMLTII